MKKQILLLLIISVTLTCVSANTWIVNHNGSGDAATIQAGIDLSVSGDTVLVADGVYTGVIIIESKMITLASYYIIDSDTTHIANTIIDGEDIRTGIKVLNCRQGTAWIQILGFSIRNCRSDWVQATDQAIGGGLAVLNSMLMLSDCNIYHCRAYEGGGIGTYSSFVLMVNNNIYRNTAHRYGGGIASHLSPDNQIEFDPTRRNSVYLNHAGEGCDMSCSVMNIPITAYLKYGTINNVDQYNYSPPSQFTINVQYPVVTQVQNDLWVSPLGSDNNSGLNAASPLQTMTYALAKANPDSLHPITVHMLPGTYKWSDTRQPFPVQLKSYLTIDGGSRDQVIMDAENYGSFFYCLCYRDFFYVKNLTCKNGHTLKYGIWFDIWLDDIAGNSVGIENVTIKDTWCASDLIRISDYKHVHVSGLIVQNCQYFNGLFIDTFTFARVENSVIKNNSPSFYDWPQTYSCGMVLIIFEQYSQFHAKMEVVNCLIADNSNECTYWGPTVSGIAINVCNGNAQADMVNCTIAGNVALEEQSPAFSVGGVNYRVNVYNTIISGNTPYEAGMTTSMDADSAIVAFDHCLVTGGENSFFHASGLGTSLWLDGNLYNTPVYDSTSQYSYYPDVTSPTIDAGTLNLPSNVPMPDYDLAGNPRVYNGAIDIGCYEWNGTPVQDIVVPLPVDKLKITAYPNPFQTKTNLNYILPERGTVKLEIFNIKGQLVKKLVDADYKAGSYVIEWNGKDEKGKSVSSGVYFYILTSNGKSITNKMLILK